MNSDFKKAGASITPEELRLLMEVAKDFPEVARCIFKASKLWEHQINAEIER